MLKRLPGIVVFFLLGLAPPSVSAAAPDAEIRRMEWHCEVTGDRAVVRHAGQIVVNNARGAEAALFLLGESPFVRLSDVLIRVSDAEGREVSKRQLKHMAKSCGFGSGGALYTDECSYFLDVAISTYPFTVEYQYSEQVSSLFFIRGAGLTEEYPITSAALTLSYPSDQIWNTRLYGVICEPVIELIGSRTVMRWSLADLPKIDDLDYAPPEHRTPRQLAVTTGRFSFEGEKYQVRSWRDVGLWYKHLADPCYELPAIPTGGTAGADLRAQCCAVYDSVVRDIRYVLVTLGIGGWRPQTVSRTVKTGSGDCKAMSTLLVSRLRRLGITAQQCLILTTNAGATDSTFPDFDFNHVITMAILGNDTVWMDPTCDHCPCGDLPSADEGTLALAVTDSGGVLVKTHASKAADNRLVRNTKMSLDSTFRTTVRVEARPSGNIAGIMRAFSEYSTADDLRDGLLNWFGASAAKYTLLEHKVSGEQMKSDSMCVRATIRAQRPVDRLRGTAYVLPFLYSSREAFADIRTDGRTIPLDLSYAREVIDSVWLDLSALGMTDSIILPTDSVVEACGNRLAVSFRADSAGILAVCTQTFEHRRIDTSQFAEFAGLIAGRKRLLDRPIKVLSVTH